ncbi:MAG: acyl-CoA dehydrogenase C-terminal domain-containing protein [Legionellales bacterium]|nr:acyl-CoA dehydrogenase C-terminal domain-containing protein [Legionellales bacterium]
MPIYRAPIRDMQFLLHDVFDINHHLNAIPAFADFGVDLVDTILEEAAKLNENLLFPLNQSGDEEGCRIEQRQVLTPKGFKEAYATYCENGWPSLTADPNYGGQNAPHMLGCLMEEMLASSNLSFSLYPSLTNGVYRAIHTHASDTIKNKFLPNMVNGQWAGVMCLTEAHCGTDLGLLRTKALPNADGSYNITGTKIFITGGDQDLTENIIHLVLARTPDAPPGVKGISLFLIPKILVDENGKLTEKNGVECLSLEHKMGIKGSATCVMNYENATGYLIGELNKGMNAMFTVMNIERLAIGLQGLAQAEISYQNAAKYAKDRLQGRAATGAQYPEQNADPIIVHPDVRRMLLTMRTHNEAARALLVWLAQYIDRSHHLNDEYATNMVALFTPVIKTFFTDYGSEACNLGLQVLGGHGYIREWGMEQFVRDARIAQIYEGANGIQALDLMKRKIVMDKGATLKLFIEEIHDYTQQHSHVALEFLQHDLQRATQALHELTDWIIQNSASDPNLIGAASYAYTHLLGLISFGYMWYRMGFVALTRSADTPDPFYAVKLDCLNFFRQCIFPKVSSLIAIIRAGSEPTMGMENDEF